jgi:hypothetical protein
MSRPNNGMQLARFARDKGYTWARHTAGFICQGRNMGLIGRWYASHVLPDVVESYTVRVRAGCSPR